MSDPFHLKRFEDAQSQVYPQVRAELRNGRKQSHWMWFIFPQIEGLGYSPTAQLYAIRSLEEAQAYLNHPVLGPRLSECTQLVNNIDGRSVSEIFGDPDDLKFRSSMTLFAKAHPDNPVFSRALTKYFEGKPDPLTLDLLRR